MNGRLLAAQMAALCFLGACSAAPAASPEPTPSETPHLNSAALASVDVSPLSTSKGDALPKGEPTRINCTVYGNGVAAWTAAFADAPQGRVEVILPEVESNKAVWRGVTFGSGWVMAIVPGDVEDLDVVAELPNVTGHDYSVAVGYLSGINSTCLAIRYDRAADATHVKGLVWRVAGGIFRKDSGDAVTFVDVPANGDQLAVYSDSALDVFGVVTTSGYQGSYHPAKTKDPFPFLLFSTSKEADGRWRTFFAARLPAGSTHARMAFVARASNRTLRTVKAASGGVFVVAAASTTAAGELFDDFSYTNAKGKKVTPAWNG